MINKGWIGGCFLMIGSIILTAQPLDNEAIRQLVFQFKNDARGPYKDIRWFCQDGTFRIPQERCPEPSPQRARYKDEVIALAKTNKIYLGQILSTTPYSDFWDPENTNSRIKQYQVEKYLRSIDDGWVLRKAQYYRGAIQAEDEENWGYHFFTSVLEDDKNVQSNYFLIRESAKDITHQGDDNRAQTIRAVSLIISDQYPAFMNIRIKIHGQPDASDIEIVKTFRRQHKDKLNEELSKKFDDLIKEMEIYYQPVQASSFNKYTRRLPRESGSRKSIENFIEEIYKTENGSIRIRKLSEQILVLRNMTIELKGGATRLALLDISLLLEKKLLHDLQEWKPSDLNDLLEVNYSLGLALAGTGYLELWEWEAIRNDLKPVQGAKINFGKLRNYLDRSRSLVEWGTGMVRAVYQNTVSQFAGFEPLSYGFIDDRIRSSLLLPAGMYVGLQGDFFAQSAGLTNKVLNIPDQGHIRGLNPGYALGELVVIDDPEEIEVQSDKIYIFDRPPADLKPVAGIATVTEGNAVSHVQLLARNLGIPNAIISRTNLESLRSSSGKTVFYAVSNSGTVIMKLQDQMSENENQLFALKTRSSDMINIPVDDILLDRREIVDLREVRSGDSGKLCGPKAANLGQLKEMFPDHVVEGFVIPFGIFLQHMEQIIPGKEVSYWEYLNSIFSRGREMSDNVIEKQTVEKFILGELEYLRGEIKKIKMLPEFLSDLENSFREILGKPLGQIPVFLRSDTNMEDLKDFSGAGLNLTVFNAIEKEKIVQGIKDVWASPYTERSYKWRQNYLLNPENVYPSILIIPSVDVDYSGVLVTKGISSNNEGDLTVAFSRGAGGAVEGQAAESYLLKTGETNVLLTPARESHYNSLPQSGGTKKNNANFNQSILNSDNLQAIRKLADEVKVILPQTPGVDSKGPFDIELGFLNNKLWLFQVRPFVENKRAISSEYLQSISPRINMRKTVDLASSLDTTP